MDSIYSRRRVHQTRGDPQAGPEARSDEGEDHAPASHGTPSPLSENTLPLCVSLFLAHIMNYLDAPPAPCKSKDA